MAPPSDHWTISRPVFESLLERLGEGGADGAAEYEVVRRKLIAFLDRRGALAPDTAADEVLDRVARRIEAGEPIRSLRAFIFGVARHVLMEGARRDSRERSASETLAAIGAHQDSAEAERRLDCLEHCLGALARESRELVELYHGSDEPRPALADRLRLTPGAMRTRVHRLRNDLSGCLARCLEQGRDRA
jgi:DNA-directed RNA polymerase specialized sigma24 family protein